MKPRVSTPEGGETMMYAVHNTVLALDTSKEVPDAKSEDRVVAVSV